MKTSQILSKLGRKLLLFGSINGQAEQLITKDTLIMDNIHTANPANSKSPAAYRHKLAIRYKLFKILPFLLISFLISAYSTYVHQQTKQQTFKVQQDKVITATTAASKQLDVLVSEVIDTADNLALQMTNLDKTQRTSLTRLDTMLTNTLTANHNFHGSSITFKPFEFSQDKPLFGRYIYRQNQSVVFSQIEDDYDYTDPNHKMTDWYTHALEGKRVWNGPYWDDAGHTTMMTYSSPFYDKQTQQMIGLVTIDVSINQISHIILSMDLGVSGYPTLTTNDSSFIHHPGKITEKHKGPKSFQAIFEHTKKPEFAKIVSAIKNKQQGIITETRNKDGKKAWLVYTPIMSNGWSLQSLFILADIPVDMNQFRKEQFMLSACWLIFFSLLTYTLLIRIKSERLRISIGSGIVSVLLFAGIAALWNIEIRYPDDPDRNNSLTSTYEVNTHVERFMAHQNKLRQSSRFINTGIEIETMSLESNGALSLSGFVWLKYSQHSDEDDLFDEHSIQFSQAQSNTFTLMHHQKSVANAKGEIQHYQLMRFEAVVDSNNDQSNYPLELEHIALTLIPLTDNENIYLIPDLNAYHNKIPTFKPGLNRDLSISGWDIIATYFSFNPNQKSSTLGMQLHPDQKEFPTLNYNIVIKRNFIDSFISNLTPLIVVAIVLFSITLLTQQMTIAEMFGIAVSMFFVVVFSHLSIRSTIAVGEIFYLEYFYLVIYLAILTVPINHFRITLNIPSRFFDYHDGLYFKAMYWPLMLVTFFVITFWQFY